MRRPLSLAAAALIAACGAPGYQPPPVPVPSRFQESARDTTARPRELLPPARVPGDSAGGLAADSAALPAGDSAAVPIQPAVRTGDQTVDQASYWRALGDTTLLNEIDKLLGKPWDDELETFRHAGDGAPVRWLHQVV